MSPTTAFSITLLYIKAKKGDENGRKNQRKKRREKTGAIDTERKKKIEKRKKEIAHIINSNDATIPRELSLP